MDSIVVSRRRWNAKRKSRAANKGFQWIARGMRPLKPGVVDVSHTAMKRSFLKSEKLSINDPNLDNPLVFSEY
jgi:hypothetical protein